MVVAFYLVLTKWFLMSNNSLEKGFILNIQIQLPLIDLLVE